MIFGILLLVLTVFGLNILFGNGKPASYYKFLIWLIFAPLVLAIGWNHSLWFYYGLPLWGKAVVILLIPIFISALLKFLFPKALWIKDIQSFVFQSLVYVLTFPIRLLWRSSQFILRRERNANELNPYRPVVGSRPPIENARRRQEYDRNRIFD